MAAAKQFVFEPAEIDGQPAPVKITYRYDFTIVEQMVKTGPQINFDGVVLERFKKRPLPRVTVTLDRSRAAFRPSPMRTATSPSSTSLRGRTRSRSPTPGS